MAVGAAEPSAPDRADHDLWWTVGRLTVGLVYRLVFRLRFVGLENVPSRGPALLASNHISVLDPIGIALGPTGRGRTVRFLAAAEFFRRPVVGLGLRLIRQIPIRRGESDVSALEEVASVITRGALAGIFPEGGVSPDGSLRPGKRGAARIAMTGTVPLIPVGVWGTRARWPPEGPRFRGPLRPAVVVAYGPPVEAAGDPRCPNDVQALTERLMAAVAREVERARALAEG